MLVTIPSDPSIPTRGVAAAAPTELASYTFDTDAESWAAVGSASILRTTSSTHTGAGALAIEPTTTGDGAKSPAITAPASQSVEFTAWVNTESAAVPAKLAVLEYSDAGGTTLLRSTATTTFAGGSFAQHTQDVTLGSDAVSFRVAVEAGDGSASEILVDDVTVTDVG